MKPECFAIAPQLNKPLLGAVEYTDYISVEE